MYATGATHDGIDDKVPVVAPKISWKAKKRKVVAAILDRSNGESIIISARLINTIHISARVDLDVQIFFENIPSTIVCGKNIDVFEVLANALAPQKKDKTKAETMYKAETRFCGLTNESNNPKM